MLTHLGARSIRYGLIGLVILSSGCNTLPTVIPSSISSVPSTNNSKPAPINYSSPQAGESSDKKPQITSLASSFLKGARTPTGELTGVFKRASLPTHADIGQGFSVVGENLRGHALQIEPSDIQTTPHNAIHYELKYVENYEDLAKALRLDARASFSGFSGGMSASLSLLQSATFSARKVYAVARMTVMTGTTSLGKFVLTSDALSRLKGDDLNSFKTMYGDSFVQQLVHGAELCALLEFSTQQSTEEKDLKIELSGNYGGFSASASYADNVKKVLGNKNVRVFYTQSGAATGQEAAPAQNTKYPVTTGGVIIMSPDEFLGRIREFPAEARLNAKNSAILWGEVADYNIVENRPDKLRIHPRLETKWILEDLGRIKMLIDQDRDRLSDLLASGRIASSSQEETKTVALPYRQYVSQELDRIGATIISYPSSVENESVKIDSYKLPTYLHYKGAKDGLPAPYDPAYSPADGSQWNTSSKQLEPFLTSPNDGCMMFIPIATIVTKCLYGEKPFEPVIVTLKGKTVGGYTFVKDQAWQQVDKEICFEGNNKMGPGCSKYFSRPPHVVATAITQDKDHTDNFTVTILQDKTTESSFHIRIERIDFNVWQGCRLASCNKGDYNPASEFGISWIATEPE